jgi:hypothetical protein
MLCRKNIVGLVRNAFLSAKLTFLKGALAARGANFFEIVFGWVCLKVQVNVCKIAILILSSHALQEKTTSN